MVLASTGCVDRQAQATSKKTAAFLGDPVREVTAQPVSTATLTQTVEVTGDVTAGQDTTIGAKSTGKVMAVFVKDGDTVTPGELIAQLDTATLNAQLQQSNAQVSTAIASEATARSSMNEAIRNQSIGPMKSTTAVRQAQAQLGNAKAQLDKMIAGTRPQEKIQAQANVASAKSTLDMQKKELQRVQTLVDQGALAGNKLDQQKNLVDTAQSQYDSAVQSLDLQKIGNRQEDIDAARASVRAAEEAVRNAQQQKKLDPLFQDAIDAAKAQIASAHAQLESAKAQVAIAQQAILDAQIRAPFAGKVLGRPIQPGTIAGNGTAIARIIGGQGVYFVGQVTSDLVAQVRPGMGVSVTLNAIPGKIFEGTVATVSGQADTVGRLFDVRIQFVGSPAEVLPGMFANGKVKVRQIPGATVLPNNAILHSGDDSYVYIVKDQKADRIPVKVGLQQGTITQVTGVPDGALVIVAGHETIAPGAKVKVQSDAKKASSKSSGLS